MSRILALTCWVLAAGTLKAEIPPWYYEGVAPIAWSQRMADSEMRRLGSSLEFGGSDPKARWDYSPAVLALGMVRLGEFAHDERYVGFGTRAVASFVKPDGTIRGYRADEYNIDNILPGRVLLEALARGGKNPAYVAAVHALRAQMATHPRTSEGGFWHKAKYPHQMWLDGLYMASPFLAQYGSEFHEPSLYDDVANQIQLIDRNAYDPETGLYWHGWNETRSEPWANKATGDSPTFWSRAIGWYAMAVVDSLGYIPPDNAKALELRTILNRVAEGVARWQDPRTGLWWQVTNLAGMKGNYLEASASSMFVYALAKGVRRGILPYGTFAPVVDKAYAGLLRNLVEINPDGSMSLTQICQQAGLGSRMADGRPRDASPQYYFSEPIVKNDPKGVGPFIQAGIEVQAMHTSIQE